MARTVSVPREVASLTLPTPFGEWDVRAFEWADSVHVCLCRGRIGDGEDVLVRMHSECLTGDALGSLRCDCGSSPSALRSIAAEGRGVLVYSTGHEGRGIGLVEQAPGVHAAGRGVRHRGGERASGLPRRRADLRRRRGVPASVGRPVGPADVQQPDKAASLEAAGRSVRSVVGLPTAAHARNVRYLATKQSVMGHVAPRGAPLPDGVGPPPDVGSLLGDVRSTPTRPYVVVKYAQTLDGRIATSTGDARWISGEPERRVSHALRAACDAVLVGVGTVVRDDPQLTVRLVPGASPIRVVLDSGLRTPDDAQVLADDASTVIVTTSASPPERRRRAPRAWRVGPGGARRAERRRPRRGDERAPQWRFCSVLVEGGARVITSFLSSAIADRLVVGIAPRVLGDGTEAVRDLGITEVAKSIRSQRRTCARRRGRRAHRRRPRSLSEGETPPTASALRDGMGSGAGRRAA